MSEKSSSSIRLAYKQPGYSVKAAIIEQELFDMVRHAVGRIEPGSSIKAQQNQSWVNMGRPKWWRFLSAWYRDGSGSWSAQAVDDFRARFHRHMDREAARAKHAMEVERAAQAPADDDLVLMARSEFDDLVQRITALEAALRT